MRHRNVIRTAFAAGLAAAACGAFATTTINGQFSPSVMNPGDTSVYTVTLSNDSLVPLFNARATIFLDNTVGAPNTALGRVTIANGTVLANTCGFSGVTATAGTGAIVLTGGNVGAGAGGIPDTCVFSIAVTSTTSGTFHAAIPANTTPSPAIAGYEAEELGVPVQNATPVDVTLQVNGLSAPTGTKSYLPSPAIAGDPTTLTLVLTNPNAGATVPLTSVTDNLPDDGAGHAMVVANPANPTVNCTGAGASNGTVTATPGASSFTLTGGTIGQSGACTVTVRVTVPTISGTSQAFSGALANTLPAGAIGNTRGLTSPAFSANLTVNTPIAVAKTFGTPTIAAGAASLMTITVTNNSTTNTLPITGFLDNLTGTSIRVLSTASVPVAAPSNPAVVCDGAGASSGTVGYVPDAIDTQITLAGTNIAGPKSGALGKCVITAYVTSNVDGPHANTIAANAVTNPAGHASPSASATLTSNAQLTVNKTVSVNSVAPGQWTQFTVTINNYSGGAVNNVSFRDILPAPSGHQMVLDGSAGIPVSNAGCTGGVFSGADGDAELRWSGGTIAAGVGAAPGTCTIVFRARLPLTAPNATVFANQIPASTSTNGSDCVDGTALGVCGLGNGPAGPGTPVLNPAASPAANVTQTTAVAVTKAFAPTSIAQGAASTLTITIRNRVVSGALTAVDLTDNLPAALKLAANPAATNTCGGTLQAFPNAASVSLTGGTVAVRPAASVDAPCAISVRVTGNTVGGPYTNSIAPADFSSSAGTIPAAATANLTVTTGITATKSFTPTAVSSGGTSRVRVVVTNASTGDLTNVSVNDDDFATGTTGTLRVANPANATSSCAGSPTLVANPGAAQAQMLGATLAAGASCDFSFDVVTTGAGPWANRMVAGKITSAEGPSNTTTVSATLTVAAAAININKSFNPVILTGGFPSLLTLTLSNTASAAVTGVGFTDVFPAGIVIYSVPAAATTCSGGTVTALAGADQVSLAGATIAAGGSCTVTLQVTSTRFLNLTNTIPAGAVTSTQGYTNPSLVSATLSTLQGLGVMKAFSPAFVVPSAVTRLAITLVSTFDPNSPTPLTLTGVTLTDNLPAGVVVAPAPNATTTCPGPGGAGVATVTAAPGGGSVQLSAAHIVPGSSCVTAVDVVAPATLGTYTNTILANSITTDQGPTNSALASADLAVVAAPTVAKAFGTSPISMGGTSVLTVTIANPGVTPLTGVSLTDNLPAGVVIAGTPAASTTCANGAVTASPGAASFAVTGATVPAGGNCFFRATVTSNVAGTYINDIAAGRIASDQGLTNPANATATLVVRSTPTVTKSFSPAAIAAGGISTLTVSLGNAAANGAVTLNAIFTDALPGNVVVAPTPNKGGTCTTGSVTATAGATSITYANGAIIPAGGCSFTVDVTSAVVGVHTNAIAAGQLVTSAGNNQDPAFADLAVGGATLPPTVAKAFAPATIAANATSTLTLTLGNGNAGPLTLTAPFTDAWPAAVVVAPGPVVGGTCNPADITAVPGANSVAFASGATIPAGGCTITVAVTSAVAGSYTNTVAAGDLATDGGTNAQPATAGLVVVALVPPTVSKTFVPNTINIGGISRLTISLGNANAGALTLAAPLVDTLPAGVTLATPASPGGTCAAGSVTAADGAGTVTFASGATIPPGGCTIAVDVTSASNAGSPYVNTIAIGGLSTDGGSNAAAATATLFVNAPQPPSVSKAFTPAAILPGGISTLTISLGNGNAAGGVLTANLVDTLPAGVVVATPPNPRVGGACTLASIAATAGGGTVTYQAGGAIPAGGCSIAVDVTSSVVNATPGHANTIGIGALVTDLGTNAVATTDRLVVLAPPTVAKSFSPANLPALEPSTLTITLGNPNTSAITLAADLVDTLPAGVTVATPSVIGGTCASASVTATAGSGSVTFANGASIAAGGCTITVVVRAASAGTYVNTIGAGALQTSTGVNALPASATLTAGPPLLPSLVITKTHAGNFSQGQAGATYTITVSNTGTAATSGAVTVTDVLPAGLTATAISGAGWTCTLATLSCTRSDALAFGASWPAITLTVDVSQTAPLSLTNVVNATGGGDPDGATASDPTTVNFVCFLTTGTISGSVWYDPDRSGTREPAETGVRGIPVSLAPRGATVGPTRLVMADATGAFSFLAVPAGDYTVQVQDEWLLARGNLPVASSLAFPTVAACGSVTTPFPYAAANEGIVGDLVWYDANRNGLADEWFDGNGDGAVTQNLPDANGEVNYATFEWIDIDGDGIVGLGELNRCGLPTSATGLTLRNGGGAVVSTRQSGILGAYRFTGLVPGDWTVTLDERDAVLLAAAEARAATGLCRTIPAGTPLGFSIPAAAASPPPSVAAPDKAVGDACGATGAGPMAATLTAGSLVDLGLDRGIACLAVGLPADLAVAKSGPATATGGDTVTYTIVVTNAGPAAANNAVLSDPAVARFSANAVACVAAAGGASCPVAPTVAQLRAGLAIPLLPSGGSVTFTVSGVVAGGGAVVNTATIAPPAGITDLVPANDSSTATTVVSGSVNGSISGRVWYDANRNGRLDPLETGHSGWRVELVQGATVVATTVTDGAGGYQFLGLDAGAYSVRFVTTAGAGPMPVNGESGVPMAGGGTPGRSILTNVTLAYDGLGGVTSVVGQSLPIDPSGTVYDSVARTPIAGATVTLRYNGGNADAFVLGGSATTVTPANGFYAFFLLPGAPSGSYSLTVTAPNYLFPSTIIPFAVAPPGYPGGPSTPVVGAPPLGQPTTYYLSFPLPTVDIVNNNIPMDPATGVAGAIGIPTLSEWALALLALMMAATAATRLRRR
jgi:uncharacterized repeat protein (TIGR01451 family)